MTEEDSFKDHHGEYGPQTHEDGGSTGVKEGNYSPFDICAKEKQFRQFLERKVHQENYGKYLELLCGFLAFGSSVSYVALLYIEPKPGKLNNLFDRLDYSVCGIFLFIYTLKGYLSTHRIQYLMSLSSALDLFIMLPILVFIEPRDDFFFFMIPFSRYIRSVTFAMIISRYYKLGHTDVDRQINIVFLTMILLAYISSGLYGVVENKKRENGQGNFLEFHDAVYFVIVTLATVGYGDEIPVSEFGRIIVLIIILFTIVIIPAQTNELLRLMQIRSRYRRIEYKSIDVRHIIVTGSVDIESLKNFCEELFHQDHGSLATNAVIIQDQDPPSEMEMFFQRNKLSLTYLAGDIFEDADLERAMLHTAESCMVLTNKNFKNSLDEDYKNILTALSLKKFVYNMNKHFKDEYKYNIKVCIQLIKPESKMLYFKSLNLDPTNDQLIMVEEIKMNLLAKSCFAPGLISCMSNLFASAGGVDSDSFSKDWLREYAAGMGHEIYRVLIQENEFYSPNPLTFKKIADICFTEYSAVIFALEIEVKGQQKSIVRLNPSTFEFRDWNNYNYYLYIICEDESLASQVQKLEMSEDKYEKYIGRARTEKLKVDQFNTAGSANNSQLKIFPSLGRNNNNNNDHQQFLDDPDLLDDRRLSQQRTNYGQKLTLKGIEEQKSMSRSPSRRRSSAKMPSNQPKKDENGQNQAETDPLLKEYDILPKPKSQTEVLIKGQNIKLSNHIVVCGFHSSIYHFILPLRAKYLKNYQQDIVIVSPLIKKEMWDGISRFDRVYLVEGSPLQHDVLKQAFIHRADKAVIMGYDPSITIESSTELNDEMIDARSIFIYKAIKKINPGLQILTELFYQSNIDFLLNKGKTHDGFNFSTLYAAGEVYIASTIDTLTAQAFYNPHIVTIVQQILVGKGDSRRDRDQFENEILSKFQGKLQQSNLWQVLVPEEFVNQTFDKLFRHLLEKQLVALALYRLTGATDNKYPYVYTNPDPKTIITYKDRVFVLGKEIPNDLIIDVKKSTRTSVSIAQQHIRKQQKGLAQFIGSHDYYGTKEANKTALFQQMEKVMMEKLENRANNGSFVSNLVSPKSGMSQNKSISSMQNGMKSMLSKKQRDASVDNVSMSQMKKWETPIKNSPLKKGIQQMVQNKVAQSAYYDDTQDQIHSLEFMYRTIQELEKRLDTIEVKVDQVQGILDTQDQAILNKVREIQEDINDQLEKLEDSLNDMANDDSVNI